MIAAVAALREWIARRQALEVCAGHVIEQQIVVEREELAQAPFQMRLERGLVRQQPVEGAVQPVVVDLRARDLEQVLQRGAAVPVLGDMQLARRLAQAGEHQDRGHRRPGHRLAPRRQQLRAQGVQPQRAPERPPEPHRPERPGALQADLIQPHRDRLARRALRFEQLVLRAASGDLLGQGARLGAALCVQFAEVRHGLLDDPAAAANRADQAPVRVRLPPLPPHGVPQVHSPPPPSRAQSRQKTRASASGSGRHYIAFRQFRDQKSRRHGAGSRRTIFPRVELRKLG